MRLALIATLAMSLAGADAAAAGDCPVEAPCHVATGDYVLRLPANWDGRTPLPLLMFFHGFADTPAGVLANSDIGSLADSQNLLLVLPAGLDRRWYVRPGAPAPRDDLAFATAVLDDVMARYPVDPRMVVAGGFSAGGFITWNLACYRPGRFTGFLPVAGAFWEPVPEGPCPGGPVRLRHVHGRWDGTVPLAGRRVGAGAKQGDVRASLAALIRTDHCATVPAQSEEHGQACSTWRGCAAGGALAFCSHPGGHEVKARWLAEGLAWLRALDAPRH
ncbi:MAG: hypothetical protein J0H01_05015 [Rhizobiales bacterium]|nr:hypothetical protein [Hyphomicrobiales bacterium]